VEIFEESEGTIIKTWLHKVDEMGNRIDELEKSIGELMTQVGVEGDPNVTPKKEGKWNFRYCEPIVPLEQKRGYESD
jgi:hypothetical protein